LSGPQYLRMVCGICELLQKNAGSDAEFFRTVGVLTIQRKTDLYVTTKGIGRSLKQSGAGLRV
jgi:hypothetical protein